MQFFLSAKKASQLLNLKSEKLKVGGLIHSQSSAAGLKTDPDASQAKSQRVKGVS